MDFQGLAGETVRIIEVGPRDGLQNEKTPIPTLAKEAFVKGLVAAGLREIEVSSFVHPKAVPQLADSGELFAALGSAPEGVRYSALVPNMRGLERAIAAGVRDIAVFTAASETFNQKNIGCGIDESFERFGPVLERARAEELRVRGYVSTVWGCPYEGDVDPAVALDVSRRLLDAGCCEVSLGDTIGVATPNRVHEVLSGTILPATGAGPIALHFHDTRGTALANCLVGLELGVRAFDSSAGGLGGCPYAPGAAGNLATEDLVYLLQGLGLDCGVELPALAKASLALEEALGRALPGRTVQTFKGRCE